jgi:hypothetical protein
MDNIDELEPDSGGRVYVSMLSMDLCMSLQGYRARRVLHYHLWEGQQKEQDPFARPSNKSCLRIHPTRSVLCLLANEGLTLVNQYDWKGPSSIGISTQPPSRVIHIQQPKRVDSTTHL